MPPKAAAKKRRLTRKNPKTIKKPGRKSDHNPCLQPDSSQLGLQEEYTQAPLSYSGFSAMMEEHEEDDEDDEEEEDENDDNEEGPSDQRGPRWEGYQSEPYEWPYGARQDYPSPPRARQDYPPQMRYDDLPPSSPPRDFVPFGDAQTFDNQLGFRNAPSSSQRPAPPTSSYTNPNIPTLGNLIPLVIHDLEPVTSSRFSGLERMRGERLERQRARCAAQAGISLPGIRSVFVYNPRRHPAESRRGQLITTGVIRPTTEVLITAPIPSQRQLPPPFRPASPIPPSSQADPAPPQHLTVKEAKDLMNEARKVMRRMVLLGNAMSTTERSAQVAEEAFLEAAGRVVPAIPASQIPNCIESCKKLSMVTTVVRGVFKKEARRALPNHYSLTLETGDTRSLTEYREAIVPPLLVDHAYLFNDSLTMSPVDHPAIIETICHALWTTKLHEALDFDELDGLDDLFSIGGAAVHNTLLEFEGGIYKPVAFSPASPSATEYKAIQNHNTTVRNTPALRSASRFIKEDMVARGTALRLR